MVSVFVPAGAAVKKPAQVKITKSTVGKTWASLKWKKAKNAKKYQVYQKKGKKYKRIKTVKGTKTKISKLKQGTTYKFKVRGINGKKKGRFSKIETIKTKKDIPVNIKSAPMIKSIKEEGEPDSNHIFKYDKKKNLSEVNFSYKTIKFNNKYQNGKRVSATTNEKDDWGAYKGEYSFTGSNKIKTYVRYCDNNVDTKTKYTYNKKGYLKKSERERADWVDPKKWIKSSWDCTSYKYWKNGLPKKVTILDDDGEGGVVSYNAKGFITKRVGWDGEDIYTYKYKYNKNGMPKSCTEYYSSPYGDGSKKRSTYKITYYKQKAPIKTANTLLNEVVGYYAGEVYPLWAF